MVIKPREEKISATVPRITQLDAVEFDENIKEILVNQLLEIEKYLRPGTLSTIKPEIKLLVDCLIFRNSVLKNCSTFGQNLLSLKFHSFPHSRLYFVLCIILPYLKERYDESINYRQGRRVVDTVYNLAKLVQLLNLLQFLREGVYPTLTHRLLGLRFVHTRPPSRGVAYNYMMRELVWHSFMELMKHTIPLINVRAVQRILRGFIGPKKKGVQVPAAKIDLSTTCAVCNFRPNTPCRISIFCQHFACYVCLKTNIMADDKFTCPRCGELNTAVRQLQFF